MNITEGKYSKSYCLKTPCSEMGFSQKASCKSQGYKNCYKKSLDEKDPKVGTGKKPKGSGRRLYTDENPKDTVSVKFRTKEDIVDTLNKTSFKNKSHKRQSQIINLIHQRVRAAHNNAKDPKVKSRFKRGLDYITNRKEKSKEKTKRLRSLNESNQTNQPLKKGDVVLVVNLDKSKKYLANGRTDLYEPKLFTPYRVFGYFHRQPQNWENPNTTQIVYKLEHLDITDEERMIDFQKGGGERLGVHLLPEDTWILQKDIQELNEGKSLFIRKKDIDERARTLGNTRRQGVDTYFPKSAIRANPMRFRPYTRELYTETEMRDKDKKIMKTNLNLFGQFPLDSYKQINPPSETETRKELEFLKRIKKNEDFIYDNDKITKQYKDRLEKIGIEYPKGELKKYMNEIKKIILILKYFFNRKRPYGYVTKDSNSDLNVTLLNSAKTPSYPSGHATQSEFISQYLVHKYPQYKQEIQNIADDISKSRMIAKVHFPSDIKFGKVLGKDLFTFIKNEDIDLKEVKPATLQSNQKKIVDGFSNFSL